MIDKQQVVDLWQECFNDSEAFVRLYFSTKYTEENTLVHIENGKVLSALQMLPYSMTCWGRELRISYISGASTWPEARGRGVSLRIHRPMEHFSPNLHRSFSGRILALASLRAFLTRS